MSSESPLVSVIVPAFNVAPYIRQAVESALAQTYPRREVIVVNDGSPDTRELELALAPYLGAISYLTQPNRGAGAARNTAIAAARGSLLGFLDGDDAWDPDFLASQVALLQQGGYDLVYADARHVGALARPGETSMGSSPSRGTPTLHSLLDLSCHVFTSTTVVRRDLVLAAGGFDEGIRRGQDFELWVRLALQGARMGYQRTVLASYRRRDDSLSGDALQRAERGLSLYRIVREKLALPPALLGLVNAQISALQAERHVEAGKAELLAGNAGAARAHFRDAWRERPSLKLLGARLTLAVAPGLLRTLLQRR